MDIKQKDDIRAILKASEEAQGLAKLVDEEIGELEEIVKAGSYDLVDLKAYIDYISNWLEKIQDLSQGLLGEEV